MIILNQKHSTSAVWQSDRRQRDNGALCKNTLEWNSEKKESTYLNSFRSKYAD